MAQIDITKMSSKGQVVIPMRIRQELKLEEGERLVVERLNKLVVLKKLSVGELKKEFERLTEEGEKFARAKGIKSEEDVVRIIHEGRKARKAQSSIRY